MKLATRMWLMSVSFVVVIFLAVGGVAFVALGPPPDTSTWAPGPLTIIDSRGVTHHVAEAPRRGFRMPLVFFTTVGVTLLFAALATSRSVVRDLSSLRRVVHRMGQGDLDARTGNNTRDEVGEVARAFDDMADRIESLVRAQRELLANVSHELRTPLSRVRVALELGGTGMNKALVEGIEGDLKEVEQLIDDLLTAARLDPALHGPQHLSPTLLLERISTTDVASIVAERFRRTWPTHTLHVDVGDHVFVGDLRLVVRLLDNILDNAGKYSAPHSAVSLASSIGDDGLVFVISDSGIGVDDNDLALLGTPFFRVDRSRARSGDHHSVGGVGLGLVLAKRIAEAHGGGIAFSRGETVGTKVTISFKGSQ